MPLPLHRRQPTATIAPQGRPQSIAAFAVTLALGAFLLFLIQPMVARGILPILGGAPAVWNVCLVFFQAVLFLGYGYAHWIRRWRWARVGHTVLLFLPFLTFPLPLPPTGSADAVLRPMFWTFSALALGVGPAYFVVSTTAPLLQEWLARGRDDARGVYTLYASSNMGSLLALLAYPTLVEWALALPGQGRLWMGGYGLLVVLTLFCMWRAPHARVAPEASTAQAPSWFARGSWFALSFVPNSLLLGVTTYLTADIAVSPFFWVLPLAIFLSTYILAFVRPEPLGLHLSRKVAPILWIPLCFVLFARFELPVWTLLVLHLSVFFFTALWAHGELALRRPPATHLTAFYCWLAMGGIAAGIFHACVAPVIFRSVLEYPLGILVATLILPSHSSATTWNWRRELVPALIAGAITATLLWLPLTRWLEGGFSIEAASRVHALLAYAIPLCGAFLLKRRPLGLAMALTAIFIAGACLEDSPSTLYQVRTFFGVHRVEVDKDAGLRKLFHGSTCHGLQSLRESDRCEPLAYYHRQGPIGLIAKQLSTTKEPMAVVGLGAGTLAAYVQPGQSMTFYEIDPAVARIAGDPRFFTYLGSCLATGARIETLLGDARVRLTEAANGTYGLLAIDAFSSDSIPVHLITREALRLYLTKIKPNGILAFHISSRFVNLSGVLADLAADAGLTARILDEEGEVSKGRLITTWIAMGRTPARMNEVAPVEPWQPLEPSGNRVWTDQYSNLLGAIRWWE